MNRCQSAGDPKIRDFEALVGSYDHIMRFYVAMDQTCPMGVAYPSTCLDNQRKSFIHTQASTALQNRFEVCAWDIFHDNENLFIIKPEVMDRDNIRMGEGGGSLGFLPEPFTGRWIVLAIFAKEV